MSWRSLLGALAPKAPTPQQILTRDQRESPPPAGVSPDLGRRIYERVRPRLPADIRAMFESGRGAIGEIGLGTPNAFAEFARPDGYVVRVHSGLSYLFTYVARVLMTTSTLHSQADEPVLGPTRSPEEATDVLAGIFRALHNGDDIGIPGDEALPAVKLEMASTLARAAEDFVLCHEFGHIAAWLARGGDPGVIEPEEEYQADWAALQFLMCFHAPWSVERRLNKRGAYAGAEFALRVFASLEHLDYGFATTHPLPGGRLLKLRDSARRIFGSQRRFLEISTIAFSWDQQLEDMERRIAGDAKAARFVVGLTPDRLLSTLSVLLAEYVRGRVSADFVVNGITALFQGVSDALANEVAKQAVLLYILEGPNTANASNSRLRFDEDDAFKAFVPRLPEPLRTVFASQLPPEAEVAGSGR